jgi:phosphatidylglycerol:prolipoprotein diacylglycerol transferase
LWQLGKKSLTNPPPAGRIFSGYLILTGIARFLVEIIRINPRSFFGMSNAQTASVVSIIIGVIILLRGKRQPGNSATPAA